MGKTAMSRDWSQIYEIYSVEQWQTLVFLLLLHAFLFGVLSMLCLLYFDSIRSFFESILSVTISLPGVAARFAGSVTALSALCLLFAAANFFYSPVPLHHAMAIRMLSFVDDCGQDKKTTN